MAEYIDIDQPLIFKDIHNRGITGTIRTILKANHTELVLADVVPVRHGRWKDCKPYNPEFNGYECSECGAKYQGFSPDNYCPNCGAKMDGEA